MKRTALKRSGLKPGALATLKRTAIKRRKVAIRYMSKKRAASHNSLWKAARHLVVDLRDNNTCQRCESKTRRMECSHVWDRNWKSLYYNPINLKTLCGPRKYKWSCHFWWHDNGAGKIGTPSWDWFAGRFPERAVILLALAAVKKPPIDRETELLWLQAEIAKAEDT